MNIPNRERRDWGLIIFIIPIGILLIFIVGQLAIGIFPNWRINADMRSNLDPNSAPGQPVYLLQPLLQQILTPMAWAQSYLTPGADISYPPFFVFEPSATASSSPTPVSPTPTTPSPTTPVPTGSVTSTPKPPTDKTPTSTSTGTCQDPLADNQGQPLPCTYPTPATCQDPLADNQGQPLPCTYPTPATCQDPLADNQGQPLPCTYPTPTGYPSTMNPGYGTPAPIPTQINVGGTPDDDGSETGIGHIQDGTYIVINLSVEVGATPDANYDLVYYEYNNNNYAYLDWIIIGLSNFADGSSYYEVFNWGNNPDPDTNSNVDTNTLSPPPYNPCNPPEAPECDNHEVIPEDLYDPDGGDDSNSTGVLIDVDNATSEPPPGVYNYVVIISPNGGSSGEPADIDAVDTVEVPIPTP